MINGYEILKKRYPDVDEESRTPNGIDLRLGRVFELSDDDQVYGIYEDKKMIPDHCEIFPEKIGRGKEGWILIPQRPYILEVADPIKIDENSAQLYRPRSTLLRSGVNLCTAVGDAGYNGKLAFLCINHSSRPFKMEKGVRFAQLIDFEVVGATIKYDGDFQNDKHKKWGVFMIIFDLISTIILVLIIVGMIIFVYKFINNDEE